MNKLTAKQEKFCQEITLGKTQIEAYKNSYNALKMKDDTIYARASKLSKEYKISTRLKELQAPAQEKVQELYGISLKSTIVSLNEIFEIEKNKDNPNTKTMSDIRINQAKLLGLDIQSKQKIDLSNSDKSLQPINIIADIYSTKKLKLIAENILKTELRNNDKL